MICILYAIRDKESGIVFFSYEKEALPVEITTMETHSEVVARQNYDVVKRNVLSYYKNHLEMIS